MQYDEYMAFYQAQQERQAQLVKRYSQKPAMPANEGIWETSAVERHQYPDTRLWMRVIACVAIFSGIILLYCMLS